MEFSDNMKLVLRKKVFSIISAQGPLSPVSDIYDIVSSKDLPSTSK